MKKSKFYYKLKFNNQYIEIFLPQQNQLINCSISDINHLVNLLNPDFILTELKKTGCCKEDLCEKTVAGIDHWNRRKWNPSLDYYLTSRRVKYQDEFDISGKVRRSIIESFGELPSKAEPCFISEEKLLDVKYKETDASEFLEVIWDRRSVRKFTREELSKTDFSIILLKSTESITKTRKKESETGNILLSYGCGFEIYIAVFAIENTIPGIYRYDFLQSKIQLIKEGQFNSILPKMMSNQRFTETANFSIFLVADFEQYQFRYRHERALRNLYIEAGRIMQDFIIYSSLQGLAGVVTPALSDTEITNFLNLDTSKNIVMTSLTLGKK
ncbi:SagB/ThcOx family dehydrogenase [Streptococcus suis]|uniref:SagB/ThcOx family dehydrogenase n=1 Tax=Streptococcus suis TaxID=1307 RepID=UPI00209AE484|nr:SagB/ThcOx family dehydrogenase [Streptococcus suis]MCO8214237.1 SagB/ThcOx family dehydrogenase [Streptococcus suis]HEM3439606.1 SagB/ThcOx family dehydrogenase [Streptococcus suis]